VRLLLDAHISGRSVAKRLRTDGHDVLAIDQDPGLAGLSDNDVLRLAAEHDRVTVTFDVKHFPTILRNWAEAGVDHAGCIIVVGMRHSEFGPIIHAVEQVLRDIPEQTAWTNRGVIVSRKTQEPGAVR
jgi:hypothetical protein